MAHDPNTVAFPGGRGTADMVSRAKAAGVEVLLRFTFGHTIFAARSAA